MVHPRTAAILSLTAALALLAGCEAQPRSGQGDSDGSQTVPPRPSPDPLHTPAPRPRASKPDLARIKYDTANQVLTLYELPDRSARWMLATPANPGGVPVDREYQFPPSMAFDLEQVAVFYTVPDRLPSPTVTLREIVDGRGGQARR
jgi:hypothetical protein